MRCREVWVHAVDLDAAVAFADIPSDLVSALIDDVFAAWARRDEQPDLAVIATDTGSRWGSTDAATTVSAPLAVLAGWLTGRIDAAGLAVTGPLPTLPPWL
jgi:maleylpyruvate isomerase